MNTWRSGYDLGAVLVSRDPHQGLDSVPGSYVGIRNVVWSYMSLYTRLVKEKDRLGKKALRNPRTNQELLDRKRWERIYAILTRRYEYGIEDVMEQYRYDDFRDEIASVRR